MTDTELEILAPAKINLVLRICGKRADGYHDIETVMQKLNLFDRLTLVKSNKTQGVVLKCPGTDLPEGEENLVYKAAIKFFDCINESPAVHINLEKNIPVAAGLGGGSSDAAATISGLNSLFGSPLTYEKKLKIAASLGADVPFFVADNATAFASGIGDDMEEVDPITNCWVLLVNPGVAVSTKWVYDNFRLTIAKKPYMFTGYQKSIADNRGGSIANGLGIGLSAILAKCKTEYPFNDLETVTEQRYGVIKTIKEKLLSYGAAFAMMSGSGSTVFGIYQRQAEAEHALEEFKKKYSGVFLTQPCI